MFTKISDICMYAVGPEIKPYFLGENCIKYAELVDFFLSSFGQNFSSISRGRVVDCRPYQYCLLLMNLLFTSSSRPFPNRPERTRNNVERAIKLEYLLVCSLQLSCALWPATLKARSRPVNPMKVNLYFVHRSLEFKINIKSRLTS